MCDVRQFQWGRFSRAKSRLVKREKTRQWLSHVFCAHKTNVPKRSARVWVRPLSFAVAGRAYQSESRVVWIVVRGQKCTRVIHSHESIIFPTAVLSAVPCHIHQNKLLSEVQIYSTLGCRFVYLYALFVNNCHIYWRCTAALIPCVCMGAHILHTCFIPMPRTMGTLLHK